MKFYISGPADHGEGIYDLLTEEGEHLASHFCSHAGYAEDDLVANRAERKKEWKERFGDYEVIWLGRDQMTKEKLIELNKKWFESLPEEKSK